ncbi:enoyl-CoA hydratase/isomerase family protein [Aquincola sp. S2]|uniref:Enoyl-CoA hydratase/isomerase family protein n=2 Tax=Pseudaquabacterium terrae TaxID=2732868 RepID=A0ABX2EP49_9BURK|nr:enoyl-CoA hydratase/isomerase family protein [Aquabacterium terrae]NRF70403.1 enoyl-CoA hydratase/isomerase family protein [Aquabacterium terrae]
MDAPVLHEVADGIATITLNRPQARNALDAAMKEALAALVPALVADASVRAVILTGAGGAFCAGGDLRGMAEVRPTMDFEGWRARMRDVQPWLAQLIELDRPLIAAVDGPAFGAGFGLALAADFVVATPRARFCLSFMKVGLGPDFGAMYTLPRVVGVQRAKELMLSAREVGADEALRLGLVLELQPEDRLLERARALARSFIGASPLAVKLIKQDVARSLASDLPTMLALEAEHQARCFDTAYQAEAVERFLAKQPPRFSWPPDDGR